MYSTRSERGIYDALKPHLIASNSLEEKHYPIPDPYNPNRRKIRHGFRIQNPSENPLSFYSCDRCRAKFYKHDGDNGTICVFHPRKVSAANDKYFCCGKDRYASGCNRRNFHVPFGDFLLPTYLNYVTTKPKEETLRRFDDNDGVFALDCEMVYTTEGQELARVTVIDYKLDTVYDTFVKTDHRVLDYNTIFSGLTEQNLRYEKTTLVDVQRKLLSLFTNKTIIVGHSPDHDMKALKMFHSYFVDTYWLHYQGRGPSAPPMSLKALAKEHLRRDIQMNEGGHDSGQDARAALLLALNKVNLMTSDDLSKL